MKKILILGAGLVAEPGIRYLLSEGRYLVIVADQDRKKAENAVRGSDHGTAVKLDVNDRPLLTKLIKDSNIVVSLLPWTFHPMIARICVEEKKHLVTASYVSDEISALDDVARKFGLIFLNEVGLDPGFDHMTAMEVINRIKADGGKVLSFESITGGLPAPDDNNNPFGYKFSWSPKGVILASRNPAKYLKDGKIVEIPGKNLFLHNWPDRIDGIGNLEIYPNRNSLPYKDVYDLPEAQTIFRGTYRYPGWCKTMKAIADLGWLSSNIPVPNTYLGYMANFTNARTASQEDVLVSTAEYLDVTLDSRIIHRLDWLGLFTDEAMPEGKEAIDILCSIMESRMRFQPGERDMVVMQHRFGYEDSNGKSGRLISTLIEYGDPGGYSAMARTVSLPLAAAVKCILDRRINTPGVQIPTNKEVYKPILKELEKLGIKMEEKLV